MESSESGLLHGRGRRGGEREEEEEESVQGVFKLMFVKFVRQDMVSASA